MNDQNKKTDAGRRVISRRKMLAKSAAAAAGLTIVPRHVLGGQGQVPPSEILNVAMVGTGGRGLRDMQAIMRNRDVRIVAICDVMEEIDYSRFYYQAPGGWKIALQNINEHYKDDPSFKKCPRYADYRVMLDKEKDIDAVAIATPDHTHAVITLDAIGRGKHVYCEKPLTHTVEEARKVTKAAREAKVATQMGNQGHSGDGIRQTCEWIWDGAIGDVREVHGWSHTGGDWSREYTGRPEDTPPVPANLDWDLWLGPIPKRPYSIAYVPFNWRGWWAFGTGPIGDMACHNLDPAFWALKLGYPTRVEASSDRLNSETTPLASMMRYEFPARGDMPPVVMTWYAGGLMPPTPKGYDPKKNWREQGNGNGILFVGDKGAIVCDGWGGAPTLLPESRMDTYKRPAATLPRVGNHHRNWIDACKGGPPACSNFDYAGPMTEVVLLGNVALRCGKPIEWDGENMKATNAPEADQYVRCEYRKGWEI